MLALALEMLRPGSSSLPCSSPCDLFAPPYPINPFLFYVFPSFPKPPPPTIPLHSQPTILCSAEESSHQTASSHIHLKVPASSPQPTVHLTWAHPFTFPPGAVEDCLLPQPPPHLCIRAHHEPPPRDSTISGSFLASSNFLLCITAISTVSS